MNITRRRFVQAAAAATAAFLPTFHGGGTSRLLAAGTGTTSRSAESLASDEDFWFEIQSAYEIDRSLSNLNNGAVSPSPRVVMDALHHYLNYVNLAPVRNQGDLEQEAETIRRRLAANFGCTPGELAFTRNTTESLMNAELGLDLKSGDEVLTTEQDYPRMIWAYQQRQKRDGIVLKMIPFPTPPPSMDYLVDMFERAITPRTRVIHFCHMTCYTGQIFPVKKICDMARSRGITTIVDGAHAFAHLPFKLKDLGCDYYGTSLHKWLCAPIGTGFLYVNKDRLPGLWPLMAAPGGMDGNIRKLEQIGTNPDSIRAGISEALTFHEGIGVERKSARLRYLKDRWARRLSQNPRVKLLTSLDPEQSCGLATFTVEGIESGKLMNYLWQKHQIIVAPMSAQDFQGIRVAPNVYTTVDEIDAFSSAVEGALRTGI